MNIQHLSLKGLYGYINKEIDFKKDTTLLVGINGSGKTSILNIISWTIKPSIPYLCVTEFEKIEISLKLKDKEYLIRCTQTESLLKYELLSPGDHFHPLTVSLKIPTKLLTSDENLRIKSLSNYTSLIPVAEELKTWEFIKKWLPSPTIIGLDRNLFTEESEQVYIEESSRGEYTRNQVGLVIRPLDRVKEIVNTEYRKRKNEILNLTSTLKNHLILSAFDEKISIESVTTGIRYKLKLSQIETAEGRVKDYFQQFEKNMFSVADQKNVADYFQHLKTITKEYQHNPKDPNVRFIFGLNASQFRKINKLLKQFEKFESASKKSLEHINTYLKTLNYFFKDSSKELLFKEDTSELCFNAKNKDDSIVAEFKDICCLSSGEQQLLILFSYLAFNSQDGKIFIIDEPELSLHIKWQEDFLEHMEIVTPGNTQVILATHSPILVGKKKQNAVLLYPYNT